MSKVHTVKEQLDLNDLVNLTELLYALAHGVKFSRGDARPVFPLSIFLVEFGQYLL